MLDRINSNTLAVPVRESVVDESNLFSLSLSMVHSEEQKVD